MSELVEVEIRPESDVYSTYRRLSYTPWFAIAELVDNATQNYFENREQLVEAVGEKPYLSVDVFYDRDEGSLTVVDNALGMEQEQIVRAIQLAKPPQNRSGRSEFGMGLKTSASWMGPRWDVVSKQLGSSREFSASFDIGELQRDKPRSKFIEFDDGRPLDTHYTRVHVAGLKEYDRVWQGQTITRIKTELASIYRRDILSGEIQITFNGDVLSWEPDPLRTELIGDEVVVWRQPVDFVVEGLPVKGWIGIRDSGKAARAGFSLFRRGRLVQGGVSQGWKPYDIFKAPNSFQSQRLLGEIDLDDWPVSHTKDAFDWAGPLEDGLIAGLNDLATEYIAKAKVPVSGEKKEQGLSKAAVEHLIENSADELEHNQEFGATVTFVEEGGADVEPSVLAEEQAIVESIFADLGDPLQITFGGSAYPELLLQLEDQGSPSEPLVRLGFPQENRVFMILNLRHPFFINYVGNDERAMYALVHSLYVDALVERVGRKRPELDITALRHVREMFLRNLRSQWEPE